MIITLTTDADAEESLDLQELAYQGEAAINQDYTISPPAQDLAAIKAEFYSPAFSQGRGCRKRPRFGEGLHGTRDPGIGRLIVNPTQ
jgi:hypothetical protein